MKIIFCRNNRKIESQVETVLRQMGVQTVCFTRNLTEVSYDTEYMEELILLSTRETPQMVWSIEYIPIISRACQLLGIAYVSWVTEKRYYTLNSKTLENPVNYIFVAEQTLYGIFQSAENKHIFYMPMGAADEKKEVTAKTVLHLPEKAIENYIEKKKWSEYLRGYIRGMVETQKRIYGCHIIEKLITPRVEEEFRESIGREGIGTDYREEPLQYLIDNFLCDIITRQEKKEIQEAVCTEIVQEGAGDNIGEINIFLTDRRWKRGIPPEAMSIMRAGGLLMINYQDGMEQQFDIGEELVVFADYKDLNEKLIYYQEHTKEREEIAKKGQKAVKERFLLEERLKDIFTILLEEG